MATTKIKIGTCVTTYKLVHSFETVSSKHKLLADLSRVKILGTKRHLTVIGLSVPTVILLDLVEETHTFRDEC